MILSLSNFINWIFIEIWGLYSFTVRYFKELFKSPAELNEIIRQFFMVGNKSLLLVGVSGIVIGFVIALQSIPSLERFGAASLVPGMVSISIIREIGPVVTALICAGKISSGIGAELGSMKVTEQIDAMEVSACNPFKYLVVTRITATTLMFPILVVYADFLALIGGYVAISLSMDISFPLYLTQIFDILGYDDVIPATVKTFFFGFAIGLVGCFKGYNSDKGTESVGLAANSAVVVSSLMIILLDMAAVQISNLIIY
jgi:phospholipid/cholesterol/gamma-HCH transport system permease protein